MVFMSSVNTSAFTAQEILDHAIHRLKINPKHANCSDLETIGGRTQRISERVQVQQQCAYGDTLTEEILCPE